MHLAAPSTIGRESELDALDRALAGARERRGGAVFLVGDAGIGKSRIANEVVGRAFDAGMRVMRGRGSSLGAVVPFRPIAEALLGLFRSEGPPQHPDLGPYRPALGRLVPEWREPAAENPESLVVLAEAVLRVVTLAGCDRGCVLVLEDLHEADAETLTVVEYLVDNLDRAPVLLLGTIRAEAGVAIDLARSATRRRTATILDLPPLTGTEVHKLAASCLGVPVADVPAPVLERLADHGGGNPFVVEEMLDDMVESGTLARFGERWRVFGDLTARVPTNVVRSILHRADRLGPQGHEVLSTAAVIGRRFPLAVIQEVTGLDDHSLLNHVHAGLAARLVVPDDQASDWYAFRHALTAEALLAGLGPAKRAQLARRSADVVETRYPGLPGDWCQLAAGLRLASGDPAAAGRCFTEAGRRALADGAASSAVTLLERGCELVKETEGPDYAEALEALLLALIEAGQVERALEFADRLESVTGAPLSVQRRATLHTQLAVAAAFGGRWDDVAAQVAIARSLVGEEADDECAAAIDSVAAYLALSQPGADSATTARRLANRAAEAAVRHGLPVVACQSWQLLGTLARQQGIEESNAYFQRMAALAEEHRLTIWRTRALALLAGNEALRDGSLGRLVRARDEAMRAGAVAFGYGMEATLAFQTVLLGDYPSAAGMVDRCWPATVRLGIGDIAQYLLVTRAALAAHQGRRAEMEQALEEFRRMGGEQSHHQTLALGVCRAVCALLEEDHEGAYAVLVREAEHEDSNPAVYSLAGRYGLLPVLRALRGELDPAQSKAILDAPPSQLRWNRHFALLASAVALGRAGLVDEAEQAMAQAQEAAEPFVMARHLGLRLVADAAITDGWGDPVGWLREAEEHFHNGSVASVAAACRALLRQAGATVGQRREGYDQVPEVLRRLGVTTREYEVFKLLVDRMGNKEIAGRLYISPRTVEKHVASLLTKTGQDDRAALTGYAVSTLRALS
jgi:DNA-binding CsgD family transcriptional regulator